MTPGDDDRLDPEISRLVTEMLPQARSEAWKVFSAAPHALDLDDLTSLAYTGLMMAAARWPAYCVVPGTPVLTADLEWVPVERLQAGDELVGVDEYGALRDPARNPLLSDSRFSVPQRTGGRYYRRSVVVSASRRVAECAEMVLEDGRSVTCSLDHKWLMQKQRGKVRAAREGGVRGGKYSWWRTDDLVPGDRIASPLRVWGRETSFEAGWLSGIYDGEGSVNGRSVLSVSQLPGLVLDEIRRLLSVRDIPFRDRERSNDACTAIEVGVRRYALELLGSLRPVRLLPRAETLWEDRQIYNRGESTAALITEKRLCGLREVVVLETSTRTFLANGLIAHNCSERSFSPGCGQDPCAEPGTCGTRYFAAYSLRRIRGAMLDEMRSSDWVTRSTRARARALRDAGQDLGRTEDELAAATGLTPKQVRDTLAGVAARPVSFDAETHDVPDPGDTESQAAVSSILAAVVQAMSALDAETQVILAFRYHQGLDFARIAEVLRTDEQRVVELHNAGVLAVHAVMVRAATEGEAT